MSDVPFRTNWWTEAEVLDNIRNLFNKFLKEKKIEILVPIRGRLVKPSLQSARNIDGRTLKSMFLQNTIYVRPLERLYGTNNLNGGSLDIAKLPTTFSADCERNYK